MRRLYCIFHLYFLTVPILSYCFATKYFGEITTSSVILSTSPHSYSVYIICSETITPSKLSHLAEKMAKISRSNRDDGSRSVVSRSERYQLLEKKRSIATAPPRIVTKVVRDKKSATTIRYGAGQCGTKTRLLLPLTSFLRFLHTDRS
jgi:hypothetical protein